MRIWPCSDTDLSIVLPLSLHGSSLCFGSAIAQEVKEAQGMPLYEEIQERVRSSSSPLSPLPFFIACLIGFLALPVLVMP